MRSGENLLPSEVFPSGQMSELRTYYNRYSIDPLLFGQDAPLTFPVAEPTVVRLRNLWLQAIREHPVEYMRAKWQMWTRQIGWSGAPWQVYHAGVDPNPWGYKIAHPRLNRAVIHYLERFGPPRLTGAGLERVWVYFVPLGAGVLLYTRSKRPAHRIIAWLCVGAFAHVLSVFFGAMGVQYRYSYPVVIVAAVAAVTLVADGLRLVRMPRPTPGRGSRQGVGGSDVMEPPVDLDAR